MGVFSKLFGKENKESDKNNNVNNNVNRRNSRFTFTEGGQLAFEVSTPEKSLREFYDTTKIIVDDRPEIVMGKELYDCFVSWYNDSDAIMFDKNGQMVGSRTNYKHVISGIDVWRLRADEEYLTYVAKELFDKKRVTDYLNASKMNTQEIAEANSKLGPNDRRYVECGRYIGEVADRGNGRFVKTFQVEIGQILHNSAEMIAERNRNRNRKISLNQERINEKREQIKKLEEEMANLHADIARSQVSREVEHSERYVAYGEDDEER